MEPNHIIQKVFVEIKVNSKEKAMIIKDDVNSFLSIDVFPKIEKYFNDLEDQLDDYILQIPNLEINLDVKDSSLNSTLKDDILQLLREKVSEIITSAFDSNQNLELEEKTKNEAYLVDNQEKTIQTFLYFLEKGYLPWWNSATKNNSFLEKDVFNTVILAKSFKNKFLLLLSKKNVQERIISQLSDEQIAQLCLVILDNKQLKIDLKYETLQYLKKLNFSDRQNVWRLILGTVSRNKNTYETNNSINFQENILREISSNSKHTNKNGLFWKTVIKIFPSIKEDQIFEIIKNTLKADQEKPKNLIEKSLQQKENFISQKKEDTENEIIEKTDQKDGYFLNNAGLILIHPFIKTFFEHCDILDPKTLQITNPELGAHLLHYVATGKTNAPEYEMVFEKFLCNIPINQTMNRHIKLSRKHKIQAKNLIESVQHNWSAMKNSSVTLLQNEFFQRPGKLIINDFDETLTVERKTQDILLDKLSWGMGLVKLPWKEKFMFVNW